MGLRVKHVFFWWARCHPFPRWGKGVTGPKIFVSDRRAAGSSGAVVGGTSRSPPLSTRSLRAVALASFTYPVLARRLLAGGRAAPRGLFPPGDLVLSRGSIFRFLFRGPWGSPVFCLPWALGGPRRLCFCGPGGSPVFWRFGGGTWLGAAASRSGPPPWAPFPGGPRVPGGVFLASASAPRRSPRCAPGSSFSFLVRAPQP